MKTSLFHLNIMFGCAAACLASLVLADPPANTTQPTSEIKWPWSKKAQAFGLLTVNPQKKTVEESRDTGETALEREMYSATQIIKSKKVLAAALKQPDVQKTDWFKQQQRDKKDAAAFLEKNLRLKQPPKTPFLLVSLAMDDQQTAAVLVNAVMAAAVKQSVNVDREKTAKLINQQLKERDALTKAIETDVTTLKRLLNPKKLPPASLATLQAQLARLEIQKKAAKDKLDKAAARKKQIHDAKKNNTLEESPEVQNILKQDPILRGLGTQVLNLELELEVSMERYGLDHRTTKALKKRLAVARQKLAKEKQELVAKTVAMLCKSTTLETQIAETKYQTLADAVKEMEIPLLNAEQRKARHTKFTAALKQKRNKLAQLDQKILDNRLVFRGEQSLTIHRPALPPKK